MRVTCHCPETSLLLRARPSLRAQLPRLGCSYLGPWWGHCPASLGGHSDGGPPASEATGRGAVTDANDSAAGRGPAGRLSALSQLTL